MENRLITRALIARLRRDELTRVGQVMQIMQRGYTELSYACCTVLCSAVLPLWYN